MYVHYGTHGTACLDSGTGEVVWRRSDLNCDHLQEPVSSPILYEDLLIVSLEGIDVQFTVALDKETGKTVWRYDRPRELYEGIEPLYLLKSYHTPVIVEVNGRPQLINNGAMLVTSHELRTGKELWRVRYRDDNPVSPVVSGHGLLFINSGGSPGAAHLLAVRQGGGGDVTDTHVVWKMTADVPSEGSPVLVSQADGANWLMVDDSTGTLRTGLSSGGCIKRPLFSETTIADGNWHRIGLTWDGNQRSLYVDDILVAAGEQIDLAACTGGLNIGCGNDVTAGSFFWTGLIDDVGIYNRAVRP